MRLFSTCSFSTCSKLLSVLFIIVTSAACDAATSMSQPEHSNAFAATNDQIIVTHQLQRILKHHYKAQKLDDTLSQKILADYLELLDPSHSIFTREDIQEFDEKYSSTIDDALKDGDLSLAYSIYERHDQRFKFAIEQGLELLKTKNSFDFSKKESLLIDHSTANYPANEVALKDLWRKKIKEELLVHLLSDKPEDEARDLLIKRYESRLKRLDKIRAKDVFEMFINSYTHTLDPHTSYFSPHESENFNINMSLQLQGIGARLSSEDDYTKIVELIAGGPAEKSGQLHASDRIIGVAQDDEGEMVDVVGWRIDEVVTLIRGEKGSVVRLLIIPHNAVDDTKTKVVRIVRDTIKLEDSAAHKEILDINEDGKTKRIGIITLPSFYHGFNGDSVRRSSDDVEKLVTELNAENIDGLIIDLRSNGGGSLEEVRRMVGLFIDKGPVVQTKQSDGNIHVLEDTDSSVLYNGPLAVMINRISASASEIFAGAIKDYDRGLIIGNTTYGKGTVQNVSDILFKGQIKLTTAMFYRISGSSTQHKGVSPHITYPTLIDGALIGESSLDNSIPWEKIKRADYKTLNRTQPYLTQLNQLHDARVKDNAEFIYLTKKSALLDTVREQKSVSLNLEERKLEKEKLEATQLTIENERRLALGEKPLKSLEELEQEAKEDSEKNKKDTEIDAFAKEAADILLDLIEISKPKSDNLASAS